MYGKLIEVDKLPEGLQELTNAKITGVFPNPDNGIFTIVLGHAELVSASQITLKFINVLGEKVYFHYQIINPDGYRESNYQIDLSSQPNGVYFYRVVAGDGGLAGSGKIVIEK